MDEQLLTTVLKRLDRIEDLINARTQNTNDRYTEIKEELGEIKADIKEMKAEETDVIRRIEILEEGKKWSTRMITGALFSGILSLVISVLAHLLGVWYYENKLES